MSDHIVTDPRTGHRFRLVASHTSTTAVDSAGNPYPPLKHPDCEGCGTKRRTTSA